MATDTLEPNPTEYISKSKLNIISVFVIYFLCLFCTKIFHTQTKNDNVAHNVFTPIIVLSTAALIGGCGHVFVVMASCCV